MSDLPLRKDEGRGRRVREVGQEGRGRRVCGGEQSEMRTEG